MTWTESEGNGKEEILVPVADIWKPDVACYSRLYLISVTEVSKRIDKLYRALDADLGPSNSACVAEMGGA